MFVTALAILSIMTPTKTVGEVGNAIMITPLSSLSDTPTPEQIKEAIVYSSPNMEVANQLLETVNCESSFDFKAVGDNGLAFGIGQFHYETWKMFNKERGLSLNYYSTKDQISMMVWAWSKGYQHHWSCFKHIYGM